MKYNARKTTIDGRTFDSKREAMRYQELKQLEAAGEIVNLRCQVEYELIPKQPGERSCSYVADFVYELPDGKEIVEDVKGYRTDVYIIKRKLMLHIHNIRIHEV